MEISPSGKDHRTSGHNHACSRRLPGCGLVRLPELAYVAQHLIEREVAVGGGFAGEARAVR